MKYRRIIEIIEFLMDIVRFIINKKQREENDSDDNSRPHSDI